MLSRRSLLFAPLILGAQVRHPNLVLFVAPTGAVTDPWLEQSVVFPRAYTASPKPSLAQRVLETGKFAHALREGDPGLLQLLRQAGYTTFNGSPASTAGFVSGRHTGPFAAMTQVESREQVESIAAELPPQTLCVLVGAYGDGLDEPQESSVHVPLEIRWTEVFSPRRANELLVSTVDLAPTMLALCNVPVPVAMQGANLAPRLLGRGVDVPGSVYIQGRVGEKDEWRALIRGYDKMVTMLSGEIIQLYNLADDPRERSNLYRVSATQLTRDAMVALLRVWMRQTRDGVDASGLRIR